MFFEKDEIDWTNIRYQEFYTKLNKIKKDNPSLWNGINGGKIEIVDNTNSQNIFSFTRGKDGNKLIVLMNLSADEQQFILEGTDLAGDYMNAMTGDSIMLEDNQEVDFAAWEYLVLVKKQEVF